MPRASENAPARNPAYLEDGVATLALPGGQNAQCPAEWLALIGQFYWFEIEDAPAEHVGAGAGVRWKGGTQVIPLHFVVHALTHGTLSAADIRALAQDDIHAPHHPLRPAH